MKREDFKIEGIPEGYRVYDVDLTPSGRSVAVLGHLLDASSACYVQTSTGQIELPPGIIWQDGGSSAIFLFGHVRATGENHVVVVEGRRSVGNGSILDERGNLKATFDAGEDVEEVLADEDMVVLFYGDQGQTGYDALSHEAMAVISTNGEFLWGHWSHFGSEEALNTWFHAAVWEGPDKVAIFADVRHECALVQLDIRRRQQRLWHPPLALATPSAVTTIGDRVILHGAGTDAEGRKFLESLSDPEVRGKMQRDLQGGGLDEALSRQLVESFTNDPKAQVMLVSDVTPEDIVEWRPGEATWRVIGTWPARQLRGLPGGRFIAVQPDGYTILSFD